MVAILCLDTSEWQKLTSLAQQPMSGNWGGHLLPCNHVHDEGMGIHMEQICKDRNVANVLQQTLEKIQW